MSNKKFTQEEFVNLAKDHNNKITVIGEYKGSKERILVRCNMCGKEYYAWPLNILRGSGCKICGHKKETASHVKKTSISELREIQKKNFYKKCKEKSPNIEVVGSFVRQKDKILVRCKKCGRLFETVGYNLAGKGIAGCNDCAHKELSIKRTDNNGLFDSKLKEKCSTLIRIGEYKNSRRKILFKCLVCGNEFSASPASILSNLKRSKIGNGCPKCAGTNSGMSRKTPFDDFIKRLNNDWPDIEYVGGYKSIHESVRVRCKKCGYEWEPVARELFRSCGCKKCNSPSMGTSILEQEIYESFKLVLPNTEVLNRDKSAIGMELDVYIPEYKIAVEYGSEYYHQEDRQKRDNEKIYNCIFKNGIKLLTIYDGCTSIEKDEETNILNLKWRYKKTIKSSKDKFSLINKILRFFSFREITQEEYECIQHKVKLNLGG